MKVLGRIEPSFNDEGIYDDPDYLGGVIVSLTEKEMRILSLLQESCEGYTFRYKNVGLPEDKFMSDVFMAIQAFTEAKFQINEFREMIDRIDDMIGEKK